MQTIYRHRQGVPLLILLLLTPSARAQSSFDKAALVFTLPWDADWVTAVSFVGPNRLAAGNNLGDILVWDLPSPAPPAQDPSKDKDKEKGAAGPMPARRLLGHTNTVTRLLTTPDQRWLISASNDRTIRYWDMQDDKGEAGNVVLNSRAVEDAKEKKKKAPAEVEARLQVHKASKVLTNHRDWVLGLSMTRDGNMLVSGDDKGEVIVWNRPAAKELRRWKLKGWAWAVAVEPQGKSLLISERFPLVFDSGRMMALKIWDPNTGELKVDLSKEFKEPIAAAAFSPDGKWLAVGRGGEGDGKIMLLEGATGKKIRELTPMHMYGVTDLVFHPDGKHLLSTGRDTCVRIWHAEDGKMVKQLGQPRGGQFKDWFHAVAVSPDGRWIAAADMAGQVQVWAIPRDSAAGGGR